MRKLPEDDERAFREAVRDVRPLRVTRSPPVRPKPRAVARFARAARENALDESLVPPSDPALLESGDELAYRRPGVREDVFKRLRRGRVPVEAEIDLHGLSRHAAHDALRDFMATAITRGLRCVRVIHGKGLRSGPGGPVLKHVVVHWLRSLRNVAAFATTRPADGGTGAVYVLLAAPVPGSQRRTGR